MDGEFRRSFCSYVCYSLHLEDDIDVSRGDMIVRENNQPEF